VAKVRIRPGARADLLEVWSHIAEDSIANADAFSDQMDEVIAMPGRMPKAGRLRDEFGTGIRSFGCGSYLIVYREDQLGVDILRVLHGARDIETLFDQE